jgi:hypothetical protein
MTSPDNTLTLDGGITRTLGDDALVTEAGEDAGFPTLQGRIGWSFPWLDAGATTLGFSSHWGEEEYDDHIAGDVDTWSINVDYLQPLCSKVALKAEAFKGENLDTYLGGIGQGVNAVTGEAIDSKGGWVALALGPWDAWTFHTGIGIDDVDSSDVEVGDRTYNRCIFGNAVYAVNKHLDVACELSHWSTDYRGDDDSDGARIQFAAKYKF